MEVAAWTQVEWNFKLQSVFYEREGTLSDFYFPVISSAH